MSPRRAAEPGGAVGSGFSGRWLAAMERLGWRVPEERTVRVLTAGFDLEGAHAEVRGADGSTHSPRLSLAPLPERVFETAARTLAGKARFAAGLLAGRVPAGVEAAFAAAGGDLLPQTAAELTASCTCDEKASLCSHLSALHGLVAERLARDPFLLFLLRGRERDGFLDLLRRHRAAEGTSGKPDRRSPIPLPALRVVSREPLPDVRPEGFFKPQRPVAGLRGSLPAPDAGDGLLGRLGPAPLADAEALALLQALHRAIGLGAKERLTEWEWQKILRKGRG